LLSGIEEEKSETKMQMSVEQRRVNEYAIKLAKQHESVEAELIVTLQKVEKLKIYRALGLRSLFRYAVEILKLDDAVAYALIAVGRKSVEIPELKEAIVQRKLTVFKANRIVSGLNSQNASDLIEFAVKHSKNEIEKEIARRNPRAKVCDKVTVLSSEWAALKASVSSETLKLLERVESLLAQKGKGTSWDDVLNQSANAFLDKHDPVRKAERNQKKKLCPGRVIVSAEQNRKAKSANLNEPTSSVLKYKRIPLTAAQKHAVFLRDQGRCTHVGLDGKRCNQDRWVDVHHIVLIKDGGTNDPENLTTLCWSHHDLIHQMQLPIEGAVTWLRSPRVAYG